MSGISISCKCITYGRVEYIEEALYSFLIQNYSGKRELLIVNDYPLQTLHFKHPDVRIINLKKTFPTIGDKENFAVDNCLFNTIAVWDDDDMAMPWHLENINKYFPGHDLLHWNKGICLVSNKIAALGNVGNSGIVYNKHIWKMVGKHEPEFAGYDMTFVRKIEKAKGKVARVMPPDEKTSWVYTWGGGSYHMSGMGKDRPGRDNVLIRHKNYIEKMRLQGKIPTGDIELKPRWKHDYKKMLTDFCNLDKDHRQINTNNLNGWAIEEGVLEWLLKRVAIGSPILELGSGNGTIELSKFYDVTTIEHNPKWVGKAKKAKYIHAPLKDGWYDQKIISDALVGLKFKVIIVDGPPGSGKREGILDYVKMYQKSTWIIDDTNRPADANLAEKIAKLVHRKNFRIKGVQKSFDII